MAKPAPICVIGSVANDVSPEILSAFLNQAWNDAAACANSLRDQFVAEQAKILPFIISGSIASVGKNSTSQSYAGYGPGKLTQVQIAEAWSKLIACYDQIVQKITRQFLRSAEFGNAVPVGFDFDTPVFQILGEILTGQITGQIIALPDVRDIRIPVNTWDSNLAGCCE